MNGYNDIIVKYFDMGDIETVKEMTMIEEQEQDQVLLNLAHKLYKSIVDKTTDIDYGEIPKSKGDITKIPHFLETKECINTIRELQLKFKQDTSSTDTILKTIQILKDNKKIFEKSFYTNSQLGIIFYNTLALAIVSSTSLLISTSVEFIKDPNESTYKIFLDKMAISKSKDTLLLKSLNDFNKDSIEIVKTIESSNSTVRKLKENNVFMLDEAIVATVAAGVFMVIPFIKLVLPLLHHLTSTLFNTKQSISDYFDAQSKLIELNAENVKYNYIKTDEEKDTIIKKQLSIADRFKKISNSLAVKFKTADVKSKKQINNEKDIKLKSSDMPKSAISSSLF